MSSSIRIPIEIPVPDRAGYGDRFRPHRSEWQPEIGATRRRQKYRRTLRTFDVQFTMSQAQYQIFDIWYQNDIRGGELEFDMQMLDDDKTLYWYTVQGRQPFSFERADNGEPVYVVRWQVTAIDEGFAVREARTDELSGEAFVGIDEAVAVLQVVKALSGLSEIGVAADGRFNLLPLQGLSEIGLSTAVARFDKAWNPEIGRVWIDIDWLRTIAAQDVNSLAEAVPRAWMEV